MKHLVTRAQGHSNRAQRSGPPLITSLELALVIARPQDSQICSLKANPAKKCVSVCSGQPDHFWIWSPFAASYSSAGTNQRQHRWINVFL